jgi:hypothetical protein
VAVNNHFGSHDSGVEGGLQQLNEDEVSPSKGSLVPVTRGLLSTLVQVFVVGMLCWCRKLVCLVGSTMICG